MTLDKAKLSGNAFTDAFIDRIAYLKIQEIRHKILIAFYQSDAFYDDLLQLTNNVFLHQQHMQFWLTEFLLFMWSYFRYREVPYNLRWGPIIFTPPARSSIYSFNSVHVRWFLIWNKLPNLVKSSRPILRILSRKSEILTVDVWYLKVSLLWVNFHISLVLLCVILDHLDTSHLTLYCNQLTSCYIICKNAKNVEHLGYWLRVCHFLCHFAWHFFFTLFEYFEFLLVGFY